MRRPRNAAARNRAQTSARWPGRSYRNATPGGSEERALAAIAVNAPWPRGAFTRRQALAKSAIDSSTAPRPDVWKGQPMPLANEVRQVRRLSVSQARKSLERSRQIEKAVVPRSSAPGSVCCIACFTLPSKDSRAGSRVNASVASGSVPVESWPSSALSAFRARGASGGSNRNSSHAVGRTAGVMVKGSRPGSQAYCFPETCTLGSTMM